MLNQEVAFRFDTVVVDNTATSLTTASGDLHGFRAVITCEDAQVRFRYDGGDPSATVGHLLNIGDQLILEGRSNIINFKAIRTGGVNGTLLVTLEAL